MRTHIYLVMGVVWLVVGPLLLVQYFRGGQAAGLQPGLVGIFGALGLLLAAYNFARWWQGRVAAKARPGRPAAPPRKRPAAGASREYNPAFDFDRSDRPAE